MTHSAENDLPDEVLIRAAYALLNASATTHTAPTEVARWHRDREAFMVTVQRQILSKGSVLPPATTRLGSCCLNVGTDTCVCENPTTPIPPGTPHAERGEQA